MRDFAFLPFLLASALLLAIAPLAAQEEGNDRAIPRTAEGHPFLEVPGSQGIWLGGGATGGGMSSPGPDQLPLQPWARAMYEYRLSHELEPHARCKASGVRRQFQTPYGFEILHLPELKRIYVFDIGGPHSFRTIYLDGRQHPRDLQPSPFGHSIGWWEEDTLVVETVGFDESFWLDNRGTPHTAELRLVERFTRTAYDNIRHEVTLFDPKAYTEPWSVSGNFRFNPDRVHWEFICQQNNYAPQLMLGHYEDVDRSSPIIP